MSSTVLVRLGAILLLLAVGGYWITNRSHGDDANQDLASKWLDEPVAAPRDSRVSPQALDVPLKSDVGQVPVPPPSRLPDPATVDTALKDAREKYFEWEEENTETLDFASNLVRPSGGSLFRIIPGFTVQDLDTLEESFIEQISRSEQITEDVKMGLKASLRENIPFLNTPMLVGVDLGDEADSGSETSFFQLSLNSRDDITIDPATGELAIVTQELAVGLTESRQDSFMAINGAII